MMEPLDYFEDDNLEEWEKNNTCKVEAFGKVYFLGYWQTFALALVSMVVISCGLALLAIVAYNLIFR